MFRFINCSQTVNTLIRISNESKICINLTQIRSKRNTTTRRPLKVLTDSGEDYENMLYKEPISCHRNALNYNDFNEKQTFDKYFDEGFSHNSSERFVRKSNQMTNENVNQGRDDMTSHNMKTNENNSNEREDRKVTERDKKSVKQLKPRLPTIPVYEKLGQNNNQFVSVLANINNRKTREKNGLILLEGNRLICDAIDSGVKLKTIYFSKEENLIAIKNLEQMVSKGLELKKVLYRDMKLFSELVTSPGIIAVAERPDQEFLFSKPIYNEERLALIIIGDNIRDPGNLGTMIRCAAAIGAEKVVLTKGCCAPWDAKVLRAGSGAHFRVPIVSSIEWPMIFNHIPVSKPFDLYIAESNNQFESNHNLSTEFAFNTINTIEKQVDSKTNQIILRDDSYNDLINNQLSQYKRAPIASNIYTDSQFYKSGTERPIVLVIGGETHGLSNQSYKLAYDYIGSRIKVPLAFGVDSLNSAVAAAVILYEIKRQLKCQQIN